MKITSVNNELVKETAKLLKSKHRDESGLFIIEGEKGVNEAFQAGLDILQLFVLEGFGNYTHKNIIECILRAGKLSCRGERHDVVRKRALVPRHVWDGANFFKIF